MRGGMFAIVLCLLVSSCVGARNLPSGIPEPTTASHEEILAGTRIEPDPQAGWVKTIGPMITSPSKGVPRRYWIEAWTDPRRSKVDNNFRIMIAAGFSKRVFLKQAYAEGRELKTKVIDRERRDCGDGCAVVETVAINVSVADIERWSVSGLAVKVLGRREDALIMVPATYFSGVLSAHQRYRSSVGATGF